MLTFHRIGFPKTHKIEKVLDLAALADVALAESLEDPKALNRYGVEIRYPDARQRRMRRSGL